MAITWQNVKDLVYETLNDTETAQAFFADELIYRFAKDAMREVSERTNYVDTVTDTLTVADYPYIDVSSGETTQVWRVEVDNEVCLPVTTDELRRSDRFWSTRTSTLPRFYMLDESQDVADQVTVRLYETPSVDDTSVKVYGYGHGSTISNSQPTQVLELPEWFAYSLMFGILYRCYEADTEMQSFKKADFYKAIWDDAVMRLRVRSFNRLHRRWRYKPGGLPDRWLSIRNRIPETIPEP